MQNDAFLVLKRFPFNVFKSNSTLTWFCFTFDQKNLLHLFNQGEAKLKTNRDLLKRNCPWCHVHVITSNSDWFIKI